MSQYIQVKNNDVTSLNNFLKNRKTGTWMVWYYAEWCGHCKNMEEDWDKLVSKKININFVKIEDSMISSLDYEPEVFGYPTIIIMKNGEKVDTFESNRIFENLYEYALKHASSKKSVKSRNMKSKKNKKGKRGKKRSKKSKVKRH